MNAMFSEKYVKEKLNRLEQINSQKRQKVQQATQAKKPQLSRMEYEKYKKILFEENNKHKDSIKPQPDTSKEEDVQKQQKGQVPQAQTGNNKIQTKDTREIEKLQDKSQETTHNIPNEDKQSSIRQSNRSPKPGEIVFAPTKRLSSRTDSKSSLNSSKISQTIATSPVRQALERTSSQAGTSIQSILPGNKSQHSSNNNQNSAMSNQRQNKNFQNNNSFQQQGQMQYPMRPQSPPNKQQYNNNNVSQQQQQFQQQQNMVNSNLPINQSANSAPGQFQRIPDNFLESQIQNGMRPSFSTLPSESNWNQPQQLISSQSQRYLSPNNLPAATLNGAAPIQQQSLQPPQYQIGYSPRETQLSSCRSDNLIRNTHLQSSSEYRETSPHGQWDNCSQQLNQLNSCRSLSQLNYQEQQGQQYNQYNPSYQEQSQQQQQQQQLYSNRSFQSQQLTNNYDDQNQQEIFNYQQQWQDNTPNQQSYQQQQQYDINQQEQQQIEQLQKQIQQNNQYQDDVLSNLGVSDDVTASEVALEELKNAQETLRLEKEQLQRELVDLHNQSLVISNKNANNTSYIRKKANTSRSQFYEDNTNNKSQRSPKGPVFIEGSFKKQDSNHKRHNLFLDITDDNGDGTAEEGREYLESSSQSFEKKWEDLEKDEEEIEKSFSLISERLHMHTHNNSSSGITSQFNRDHRERRKSSHGGINQSRINNSNSSSNNNRQKSCGRQDYYKDIPEYDDFDWLDGIEESFSELKTINKTDLMPLVQDIQQHSAKKTYLPTINASGSFGSKVEHQEDAYTKLKNSILMNNNISTNSAKESSILGGTSGKRNNNGLLASQAETSHSNISTNQANNNSFLSFQKKKQPNTDNSLVDINKSINNINNNNSGELARSVASPQFGMISCSQSASRLGQSFLSNDSDGMQSSNNQKTFATKGSTVRERYDPINGKVKINNSIINSDDGNQDCQYNSRNLKGDNQENQKLQKNQDTTKWDGEEERRQQEYITQKLAEMGVFEANNSDHERDGQDRQELLYSETTSSYNPLLLLSGQQEQQEQQIMNNHNFERYFNSGQEQIQKQRLESNKQQYQQDLTQNSKLTIKHRNEGGYYQEGKQDVEEDLQASDLNNYNRFKNGLRQSELFEKEKDKQQQFLKQQTGNIYDKGISLQVNKPSNTEKNIQTKQAELLSTQNNQTNQLQHTEDHTSNDVSSTLAVASNTEKYNKFNQIMLSNNNKNTQKETSTSKQGVIINDKSQIQQVQQKNQQDSDNDSSGDELEQTIKQKLDHAAKKRILLLSSQTSEATAVQGQQQQQLQNGSKEQINRQTQDIPLPSFFNDVIINNNNNNNNQENKNNSNNNTKKNYSIDQLFEKQDKPSRATTIATSFKSQDDSNNSGSTKDKISSIQSKLNDLFNKKSTKNTSNNTNNHRNEIDTIPEDNYQSNELAVNSQTQSRKSNLDLPKQESTNQLLSKLSQDHQELQINNSKTFDSDYYENPINQQYNSHQQDYEFEQQGQQLSRIDRRVIDNLAEEVKMLMKMQNIGQESEQQNAWRDYEGDDMNQLESESRRAFWPRGQQGQLHEIEEEEDHSVDNSVLEQQQQNLARNDQFMRQY